MPGLHRCPRGPRRVPAVQGPVASAPEPGPAGRALLHPGQGASSQAAPAYFQARRDAGRDPKEGCVLSLQEDWPTGPCARPAGKGLTPVRAWLLSSQRQHPSCSTERAHSSAPATLAPAVPARAGALPSGLCALLRPSVQDRGCLRARPPAPDAGLQNGADNSPAGPRSTRPDLCPAGAPCTGASHDQRGCNGWAEPVPPRGLQTHVLRRAPGSPVRASALRICSRPGGDNNPSCPCAAALCPPGNGSALPAGPPLAPRDGQGQCRPSWGGPPRGMDGDALLRQARGHPVTADNRPASPAVEECAGAAEATRSAAPPVPQSKGRCTLPAGAPPPAGPPDSEAHCLPLDDARASRSSRVCACHAG